MSIMGQHPRILIWFQDEIKHTDNFFGTLDELKTSSLYLVEENSSGDCLVMVSAKGKEAYLVSISRKDILRTQIISEPDPMSMAMNLMSTWYPLKNDTEYCDFCDHLNITEEQQQSLKKDTGRCLDHICNKLKRRVLHNGHHPHLPKLTDCPLLNKK